MPDYFKSSWAINKSHLALQDPYNKRPKDADIETGGQKPAGAKIEDHQLRSQKQRKDLIQSLN